jgi:hypothetical protein
MAELRTQARFPDVARGKGHYESFYLRAFDPARPRGVWIRHTVHKRPGADPKGSLWFTLFDGGADGPTASKVTLDDVGAGPDHYIHVGPSRLEPGHAAGSTDGFEWDLGFDSPEEPLYHLPRGWMYRAPLPRTKLLTPYPGARFDGWLAVGDERVDVSGWQGMVGHNWGAEHAERWIWMHGSFAGDAWLDGALGRVKLAGVTTPWVSNAVLSIDGKRHRLSRVTHLEEQPTGCAFGLKGRDIRIEGTVGAERKDFVGWVYADPGGSEHHTVNCSIARMTLTVERDGQPPLELETSHGAAYELGMRERDHGMPIQPFPDG